MRDGGYRGDGRGRDGGYGGYGYAREGAYRGHGSTAWMVATAPCITGATEVTEGAGAPLGTAVESGNTGAAGPENQAVAGPVT